MNIDMQTILWIAWGSAVVIPIKIYLLIRYIRKKIAQDEAAKQEAA
uniref:Uncharacterized protein n=1 Tax=Magnetococcus massalia (strain MO-1) TaxID=451514 RepID=A0A1S7LM48_MAGMO|nr:protein of unknown function [Candidatus Magnetococcus massalia]